MHRVTMLAEAKKSRNDLVSTEKLNAIKQILGYSTTEKRNLQ
jgi:hypothetical protein